MTEMLGETSLFATDISEMSSDEEHDEAQQDNDSSESTDSQTGSQVRRARAETHWPTDTIVVQAIGEDGMPLAKNEKRRMRILAGLIARQKVSLLLPSFRSLKSSEKKDLFDSWVMPFLEFNEDMYWRALKRAMKAIAKCWRSHKSKLINEFMLPKRSPFERFTYLKKEDWEAFVELKSTEVFKQESEKFKELRQKNKHNHRLGTAGYDGKMAKWQAEDAKLAKEGRLNPWLEFPGRSQNWLRARGKLLENGEISFSNQETKEVSDKIKEYSEDSSCNNDKLEDPLSKALGTKEHPGRVRGFSSYDGWKLGWPEYKKKRGLSHDDVEKLSESIRAQVTQDIIASIPSILAAQGLKLVPISPSPNQVSPAEGRKSSCASVGNDEPDLFKEMMQQETDDPDSISLLSEPTPCALMSMIGGYRVEVARGMVHPTQSELHCVPINNDCAVVFVDHVHKKHRNEKLELPPNDEITTIGQALLQRVQWRKNRIVLNPMEVATSNPECSPSPASQPETRAQNKGQQGKPSNLPEQDKEQQAKTLQHKVQRTRPRDLPLLNRGQQAKRAHSEKKEPEQKKLKSFTASEAAATSSKKPEREKALVSSAWAKPNSKYQYGKPMMTPAALEKAGLECRRLHKFYMEGCGEKKKNFPISFKQEHFLCPEAGLFFINYDDLYDLFNIDGLDSSILRSFCLYLSQKARKEHLPVAFLDPQSMSLSVIKQGKESARAYVEKALSLSNFSQKAFVMFACNTGGHWIAVMISLKWCTVWYMDSLGKECDTLLVELLDEAFMKFMESDPRRKKGRTELKHLKSFPCHKQPVGQACGFYAAYHLLYAASVCGDLKKPEDFSVPTDPLDHGVLSEVRHRLASFFMSEVISANGEFHYKSDAY